MSAAGDGIDIESATFVGDFASLSTAIAFPVYLLSPIRSPQLLLISALLVSLSLYGCSQNVAMDLGRGYYLGGVGTVVHKEELEISDVVDQELLEPIGEHMLSLLVGAVTNVWHQSLSLELTADTGVDTLWPPP